MVIPRPKKLCFRVRLKRTKPEQPDYQEWESRENGSGVDGKINGPGGAAKVNALNSGIDLVKSRLGTAVCS
jgi:hypothetical protein